MFVLPAKHEAIFVRAIKRVIGHVFRPDRRNSVAGLRRRLYQ
jgi:hypothetical protein